MKVSSYVFLLLFVLIFTSQSYSSDDLFSQIDQGNLERVRTILDQHMNLLNEKNDDGTTPLNYASLHGKVEIVSELINRGADASIGDNENSRPIHCAAISGDTSIIDLLLAYGADINARDDNGLTPLMFAISYRQGDAVELLLNKNADVTISTNGGLNPLCYAVLTGQANLIEKLIEKGADPNSRTGNNRTPLMLALSNADYDATDILLNNGARVEDTTNEGISMLFYAMAYCDSKFIYRMIDLADNFAQTNDLGMTMLHYAAARGFTDIAGLLCDKGIDVDARCINGRAALYYATIWNHPDVADLLIEKGAQLRAEESLGLSGPYLGQNRPGRQPEELASNVLLTPYLPHGRLIFSPDGNEIFWCDHAMPSPAMWHSRQAGGVWQRPTIAGFTDPALEYADGSPAITYDGKRLYYHSHRPTDGTTARRQDSDIWYVERADQGWGAPVNPGVPVNTDKDESAPSVSRNGNLYFIGNEYDDTYGEGDIYVSELVDGKHLKPRNLGPAVNSAYREFNPSIAPDETYLVFSSDRPSSSQGLNLFVSFKKRGGGWTEAVYFGQSVTSGNAWQSSVTPDGKYIVFLSDNNYRWFSTDAVYDLRDAVLCPESVVPTDMVFNRSDQDFGECSTRIIELDDLDADGDLDAVFSCGQVWLNDGRGRFSLREDDMAQRSHGMDIGDVDNDGDADIVFAATSIDMYINDGRANFEKSEQVFGDTTRGPFNVLLADFDYDSDLDLAAYYGGGVIVVYVNDGSGAFGTSDMKLPSKGACDLDGDGDIDFFVRTKGKGYKVMLNDGRGRFTEYWNMPDSSIDFGFVSFGDIDNDGDADVISTNGGNNDIYPSVVFINDGSGRFEVSDMKLPRSRWGNVTFGDLNNDGWLDAFVSNFTLPNYVLLNDGSGTLSDSGLRLGGNSGNMISAIGDLDGDGDLDIFVSNFEGGSSEVWFNQLY